MSNVRTVFFALAGVWLATVGWSQQFGVQRPAVPAQFSGKYALNFHLQLGNPTPLGARILCKARIDPKTRLLPDLNQGPAPTGIAVEENSRTIGSWANCTVEVPFAWVGDQSGAAISYEIDTISDSGAVAVLTQGIIAPPSAGGVFMLHFNLRL